MAYQDVIHQKLMDYISLKKHPFKKSGSLIMVECPVCHSSPFTAQKIPNVGKVNCFKCKKKYTIIDFVKGLEDNFKDKSDNEIAKHIIELFEIKVKSPEEINNIKDILNNYKNLGLYITPLMKNSNSKSQGQYGKQPIECKWEQTPHNDVYEWEDWIASGLNIGMVCGLSHKSVLDIDVMRSSIKKKIYEGKASKEETEIAIKKKDRNLKRILKALGNPEKITAHQYSLGGIHIFFNYVPEFRKCAIKGVAFNIDIEHDNGFIVVEPSIIGNTSRKWVGDKIVDIPENLKKLLVPKMDKKPAKKQLDNDILNTINSGKIKLKDLDGICNNTFVKLGGILRKRLSPADTAFVLELMNYGLLDDPMDKKTITSMCRQIEGYSQQDKKSLKDEVLDYLVRAQRGRTDEIEIAVFSERVKGENKKQLAQVMVELIKEDKIYRRKNEYFLIKHANWKTNLIDKAKPIDFKVPYLNDIARFKYGEQIIIGAQPGAGKTTIAMNIVERLVRQGKVPKVFQTESKNFIEIALARGLKEGDFLYEDELDPMDVEFDRNSIIILDWLNVHDFTQMSNILKRFKDQLIKTNSFLITLTQLKKESNEWFAPNLIDQYPSLAVKFLLDDIRTKREYGRFIVTKRNRPKYPYIWEIPTIYNKETEELKTVTEIEAEKKK